MTPLGAFVTASLVDGDPDGARRLAARWTRLTDRARELRPSPNGIVAMPVFAPLRTSDEQPTHDEWRRLVGMYAGAVGRGRIDKVVLARRVGLRSPVDHRLATPELTDPATGPARAAGSPGTSCAGSAGA